jgi:hypothetical protein
MRPYSRLTQEQRYQIAALMQTQQTQTAIAQVLGVHKATITREVRRGTTASGAIALSKRTAGPSSGGKPPANLELAPPLGARSTPNSERIGVPNKLVAGSNGRIPTPSAMNGFISISSPTKELLSNLVSERLITRRRGQSLFPRFH